jgi:hypothetical protein
VGCREAILDDRSLIMTLPRTAGDVLARHTVFEIESIDRMYCNVYQPRLQHPRAVAGFIRHHLGCPVASSAVLAPISEAFVTAIKTFAGRERIPIVDFVKGQRKDDVMHEHLAAFDRDEGVLFIGRAQEKAGVFRTEKRRDSAGVSYPWIVRATAMVNQWYFYCVDTDFGPFFLKFSSYFPYTAKLCINGNEYAKRQTVKAGIGFTALDNGFATCENPAAVQDICDGLSAATIDALLRKWLRLLPAPIHRHRPGHRLPLRHLRPAGRVLPDPDARTTRRRQNLLRPSHPRQPRHRPTRPGQPDLRPAYRTPPYPADPGPVPDPDHHRRRHAQPAYRLQNQQDQAVPQTRPRAPHRNHHQRHPRLRHR